jgi:hypothetical protein
MIPGGQSATAHDFVVLTARRIAGVDLCGRRYPERKSRHAVRRRRVRAPRDKVRRGEGDYREPACRLKRERHQMVSEM